MFLRSTSCAVMFATLVLAAPAGAAVVEWQAGPLGVAGGQALQVGVQDPNYFCSVSVQVFVTLPSRIVSGVTTTTATRRVDTSSTPTALSPGGVLVVGISDPEIEPGDRVLAMARVRCDCRGITATDIRNSVGVTLEVSDPNLAETRMVMQAVPIP